MIETKLFPGVQTFLQEAGESGCYALCILKLAEKITGRKFEPVAELKTAIDKWYIHYSWKNDKDADNMFVNDPAAWLKDLTGKPVTVAKVYEKPVLKKTIGRWIAGITRISG